MTPAQEIELFAALAGHSRLEQWLRFKLDKENHNLAHQPDPTAIFRMQGRAQLFHEMLNLLDKAPKVARNP